MIRCQRLPAWSWGLLSLIALPVSTQSANAQTVPSPSAASFQCSVVHGHTAGEDHLAAERYKEAAEYFRKELSQSPQSLDAQLGLVDALLGQDNLTGAKESVDAMAKANPKATLTQVAQAHEAFRAGGFVTAAQLARSAAAADRCEGRALAALGEVMRAAGYNARAAALFAAAHSLRPDDEAIRRSWIGTLSPALRLAELERYIASKPNVSTQTARDLENAAARMKARRPDECRLVTKLPETKLSLQPVPTGTTHPSAYALDVSLDGKRRRLELDTGAGGIVLSKSAARALGIEPEIHTTSGGVGEQTSEAYLIHVPSIKIGDLEFANCMVQVVEHSRLEEVDGLIGMDFLGRYLVTLDFWAGEVRLSQLPKRPDQPAADDSEANAQAPRDRYIAPEMKDYESVLRFGHAMLIPAGIRRDSQHYIIMDTGAAMSNFALPFAREVSKLHDSPMQIRGITSKVNTVYTTDDVALLAGSLVLPAQKYVAYDMTNISHSLGFETAGLLGLPTLQRLTLSIDYRDNLVKLKYDSNHDKGLF